MKYIFDRFLCIFWMINESECCVDSCSSESGPAGSERTEDGLF